MDAAAQRRPSAEVRLQAGRGVMGQRTEQSAPSYQQLSCSSPRQGWSGAVRAPTAAYYTKPAAAGASRQPSPSPTLTCGQGSLPEYRACSASPAALSCSSNQWLQRV